MDRIAKGSYRLELKGPSVREKRENGYEVKKCLSSLKQPRREAEGDLGWGDKAKKKET